jgi:hypothetical protein
MTVTEGKTSGNTFVTFLVMILEMKKLPENSVAAFALTPTVQSL